MAKKTLFFITLIFLSSGCATTGSLSRTGWAFIGVRKESGVFNFDKGNIEKKGESCSYNILGFLALGDSGISAAKEDGKINRISYIDTEIVNVSTLFGMVCTIAYGK